jgi:Family of unknown function (DUF5677)
MGKKKRPAAQGPYSRLEAHSRVGTRLLPRLSELSIKAIHWERDILPEHLWIGALAEKYSGPNAQRAFMEMMDALDSVWEATPRTALGFISDFAEVPEAIRADFKKKHEELIRKAFQEPIGRILAFYPQSPAAWLVDERFLSTGGSLDPEADLGILRRIIWQLLPGRGDVVGPLRFLPVMRLGKHRKLSFARGDSLTDALVRYPGQCTDIEKRRVESYSRATVSAHMSDYAPFRWSQYFWRHNYDLAVCRPAILLLQGSRPVTEEEGEKISECLFRNASRARGYLNAVARLVKPDLYAPERDEILFGLVARAVRLYVLMCEDPNLWARDVAGIFLRCLTDVAINFAYLARRGTPEDFERFRQYGEGQQKLLMLHLQDNYAGQRSLEGRTSLELGEELGNFVPELLQIELGNWSKKDSRKLAQEAGLERFYRFVFTPTSSDLHGTWFSLKSSNLSRCDEVLHRFHRLPAFAEPPMFMGTALVAQEIMEECVRVCVEVLSYPALIEQFDPLPTNSEEAPEGRGFPACARDTRT